MYRVIIVEDDPMVAAINRQYTEHNPQFQVQRSFRSGAEALEYLQRQEVDLIILDYFMPLMTGAQFLDQLHGMGIAPAVVMVTSAGDTQIVRSLLARGVMDYLVKPFDSDRFQAALEKFCQLQLVLSHRTEELSQAEIDRLTAGGEAQAARLCPMPKGLNEATLDLVRSFLQKNTQQRYNSEQVAEQVRLSRITIRRYVNYMVETGELASTIDYQTGGRPSIKYHYKQPPAD